MKTKFGLKRVITNEEWRSCVRGTPDGGGTNGPRPNNRAIPDPDDLDVIVLCVRVGLSGHAHSLESVRGAYGRFISLEPPISKKLAEIKIPPFSEIGYHLFNNIYPFLGLFVKSSRENRPESTKFPDIIGTCMQSSICIQGGGGAR